jgi:PAS domain S-box-containing protein
MNKPHNRQEEKITHKQAKEGLKRRPEKKQSQRSEADLMRIVHAMEIQLMELKAQNDDLRQAELSARLNKKYLEAGREVLQILNEFGDPRDSIQRVLDVLKKRTGFDAVGIRLQKDDDFPYYAQDGYSGDFLLTENTLAEYSEDGQVCRNKDGNVSLECTCGLVLSGKTDPENPLFTAGGSAWTNDSLPFLDILPGDDPRNRPRNNCIHKGYTSVALVPIRNKEKIIGLIQLNDHRKDCFDLHTIELLEGIASHIGEAFMRKQAEDDLKESKELLSLYIIHSPIYSYRKLAEQAMRISDEKYRTMLNSSPDGILLINMKGIITEVSEIGMELFGVDTKDDLAGNDLFQFVPPDDQNTLKEIIEKTMNEGLAQNIGLKFRKKNQSVFAGETSATLIQGPDGVPVAFMIIIRDISPRKKLETKQGHADRMANLGEMASGIAHEINQPLNIISMVMDKILFESAKTETIDIDFLRNKSDKIFENITRIRNIIDQIRAFSRSHDGYVLSAFNINTSIGNATSMIAEQFKHLGIKLMLQLEKKNSPLFGNSIKFEQVIVNLLLNAKDAVIDNRTKREGNNFDGCWDQVLPGT